MGIAALLSSTRFPFHPTDKTTLYGVDQSFGVVLLGKTGGENGTIA